MDTINTTDKMDTMNNNFTFQIHNCAICEAVNIKNIRALSRHLSTKHKDALNIEYITKQFYGNIVPLCRCGCSMKATWNSIKNRYNDFIKGHNAQVTGFSKERQPKFSNEQLTKRAIAIRNSYASAKKNKTNVNNNIIYKYELCGEIFDAYIEAMNLLICIDDIDSLVADKQQDLTLEEIIALQKVYTQCTVAAANKCVLARFSSTQIDLNSLNGLSIEQLLEKAYVHLDDTGSFKKFERLFWFSDDLRPVISREQMIIYNEIEKGKQWTKEQLKPELTKFYRAHFELFGPYYPHDNRETLFEALKKLQTYQFNKSSDKISSLTNIGSSYLKDLFKSYWNVEGGPIKQFYDDVAFDRVISYRLGLNNSKPYDYKLSSGQKISCKETFDINIKNIRYGFVVQRAAVSWFKPTAAYEIYKRFVPDSIEAPVIWDPSCGFGARLLAFVAAFPNGKYIGTDPSTEVIQDLNSLKNAIKAENIKAEVELHNIGSEIISSIKENSLDLVFTSPPYFSKEKYINESTQCWKQYPNIDNWTESYLKKTFETAYKGLKAGCKMVINIDKENKDVIIDTAKLVNFSLEQEMKLTIGRDHFSKKAGHFENNFEPILVFKK